MAQRNRRNGADAPASAQDPQTEAGQTGTAQDDSAASSVFDVEALRADHEELQGRVDAVENDYVGFRKRLDALEKSLAGATSEPQKKKPKDDKPQVPFRVRAKQIGFYDNARRKPDDEFTISGSHAFSELWMERVEAAK